MAQYTPSSGDICRPYRSPWGAFPVRAYSVLSTSLAIQLGKAVTLSTSFSTSAEPVIGVVANTPNYFSLVGIAAEGVIAQTSSGSVAPVISVYEANPNVEYKAITKGGANVSSNIGLRKSLVWDSTLNVMWVDLTASTATDWRVVITQNIYTATTGQGMGDSGGYVAFRFLTHGAEQWNSTIASSSPLLAFYS